MLLQKIHTIVDSINNIVCAYGLIPVYMLMVDRFLSIQPNLPSR